ncbi:hypothetical protein [Croceicoccus gelatinilyticus]|uniref:ATP-dependent DNA ligase n=1 Tax=Croceicoccus gelatinilyticus TaxID=2835536 RepID=UPI001BCCEB82|nr:hypothetical protein [Croceicoccus gelatinilyticus]MBS7671673.1 ATP-dependent DNA ligase [Croceicoccus gelatinilyticus]
MSDFPTGWALQKPVQTIEPDEFARMWRANQLIATHKRDGHRGHVITAGAETRIFSRNGTVEITDKLPHLVAYYAKAPEGYLIDTELHTEGEGTTSLQDAMNYDPSRVRSSPFDMLDMTGRLATEGYEVRRGKLSQLEEIIGRDTSVWGGGVDYQIAKGASYEDVLAQIERDQIEGVVVWHRLGAHKLNTNGSTKRGQSWKIKIRLTEDVIVTKVNPAKDPANILASIEVSRRQSDGTLAKAGKIGSFEVGFDKAAALARGAGFVVEISHFGEDERGNLVFPKVTRLRDDLAADFGITA